MGTLRKTYIDKETLYRLYVLEDRTAEDIGNMYSLHHTTILRRLRKLDIPIRTNTDIHGGKVNSEETRIKMSEASKGNTKWLGRKHSREAKDKLRQCKLGSTIPLEVREKMSKTHKKKFENPEYKNKVVRAVRSAQSIKPNKPETAMIELLNEIDKGNWKYVGDGDVIIDGRIPDFVNINGKKKIIEVFGVYWHGDNARCYEETEQGRIEHFKKYGFDTLIIWDVELYNQPEIVKQRIEKFIGV